MKQHVMVILCDQLRPDFLSCYNPSSPVQTPNIDSLAADGVRFEHATTASPVCAPGRACMMTGRWVSDHQVWTNDVPFRDGIDFLPARMKENGYACGAFGKLHHFPAKDSKGFDVAWQMEEGRLDVVRDDYLRYLKERHPSLTKAPAVSATGHFAYTAEEYYETQIAQRAMDFIAQHKDEQPCFTWVSFQGPHTPMDPPDVPYQTQQVPPPIAPDYNPDCEVAMYRKSRTNGLDAAQTERYRLGYAQMLEFIDGKIGEMVQFLKENNLYEQTTILFSTDHGDLCGDYQMFAKGPFWHAAQLEVPMILANHPRLPQDTVSDLLTSNLDIGATVLRLAGDEKALGYSLAMDALYLQEQPARETVYTEFCDSMKLISTKTHRFAYYPFTKECALIKIGEECINLANDPAYHAQVMQYMMDIMDYMILAKGVQIEAQDLTPKVQQGLAEKHPRYQAELPLVFPIASKHQIENLKRDGLDPTYNEFCKDKTILRFYRKYWET